MDLNPDVGQTRARAARGPKRFASLRSTGGILLATILLFVVGGLIAPQSLDFGRTERNVSFRRRSGDRRFGPDAGHSAGRNRSVGSGRDIAKRSHGVVFRQWKRPRELDAGARAHSRLLSGSGVRAGQRSPCEPRSRRANRCDDWNERASVWLCAENLRRHSGGRAG